MKFLKPIGYTLVGLLVIAILAGLVYGVWFSIFWLSAPKNDWILIGFGFLMVGGFVLTVSYFLGLYIFDRDKFNEFFPPQSMGQSITDEYMDTIEDKDML